MFSLRVFSWAALAGAVIAAPLVWATWSGPAAAPAVAARVQAPSLPERRAAGHRRADQFMRFLRDVRRPLLAERGDGVGLARAALQLHREGVVEQCVVAVVRLRSDVVQRHVRESWEGGHA